LRGGAQTIDTACSSSLVALHLAARALADDPGLEAAVVGGVNLLLSPYAFIGFSRAGMLSARGRCQVFDAAADGYVRAEGAGVVILRRLADAKAAGEPIRALLLGTGTNTAGRTIGISLPNRDSQAALLTSVLQQASVHPDRFLAFEAHGTGTQAGDPAEAWAIGQAIARHRTSPLPIGSAKANIGHLEAGAGMAGLLKSMLMLEQGFVPPALHFANPNPAIDFTDLNLIVLRAAETVAVADDAVMGVNAFGFGGTNAAAILGRAPHPRALRRAAAKGAPPLILSARSAEALRLSVATWRNALAGVDGARAAALARGRRRGCRRHDVADPATQAAVESRQHGVDRDDGVSHADFHRSGQTFKVATVRHRAAALGDARTKNHFALTRQPVIGRDRLVIIEHELGGQILDLQRDQCNRHATTAGGSREHEHRIGWRSLGPQFGRQRNRAAHRRDGRLALGRRATASHRAGLAGTLACALVCVIARHCLLRQRRAR
jgi:acyl transferase domain-containing protein